MTQFDYKRLQLHELWLDKAAVKETSGFCQHTTGCCWEATKKS